MATALVTPKENRTISALKRTAATAFQQDSPFVIPPSPLMKRLGCGTYVTVYRYKRRKQTGMLGSPWAIKKAKKGHARRSILDRLAVEAKILRSLHHPNIVLFKKFTKTPNGDVCLSMEAFGKGLDDIIYRRQENEEIFTAKQTVQVAYSIARALDYLHNEHKLLHGDIKSGNILVKNDFEHVKLCDFGVSIFMKDDLSAPKNPADMYVGSEPWNSKEVLNGGPVTDKADVFAYGLVLWEMLALDVPHVRHMHGDVSSDDLDGSFLSADDSLKIPEAYFEALGTRPPMPDFDYSSEYDPVIGTFICCTIEDYQKRPTARHIVSSLKEIVSYFDIQADPSPFLTSVAVPSKNGSNPSSLLKDVINPSSTVESNDTKKKVDENIERGNPANHNPLDVPITTNKAKNKDVEGINENIGSKKLKNADTKNRKVVVKVAKISSLKAYDETNARIIDASIQAKDKNQKVVVRVAKKLSSANMGDKSIGKKTEMDVAVKSNEPRRSKRLISKKV